VLTYFYPEVIEKIAAVLEKNGFSVVIPRALSCCGFPYLSQGWKERFIKFRDNNSRVFKGIRFKHLVVPCGTGVMTFRNYYGLHDPGFGIYELTEFFYKYIKDAAVLPQEKLPARFPITFHDPCHHLKTLGLSNAPRHFIKRYGDRFIDNTEGLCCGFGGIFSVGFPSTSKKILKRKEDQLKDMGVGTVVTACPGCYLHLKGRLTGDIGVKHFIDLFT
jgi:glycolate oxidase iron-sulfur subunit